MVKISVEASGFAWSAKYTKKIIDCKNLNTERGPFGLKV